MSFDAANTIQPALNPGDQLGYFDVQSPLAAGGMSLVWKGYDRMLDRHVAIKQVAGAAEADEEVRQRFNNEAELQKRVSSGHKNIVDVVDMVDDPRGLFIVTEYVDGSSLDHVLGKLDGPMDPKQALGIMQQVALGLSAIHEAGVLHRDLKPSNILLPREGGVKICDFGLAALQVEQDALTVGTARYMAPELFTGEQADARADLYSLGMISYEMFAGRPAYEQTFKTVMRDQRNQALRWMKWHTNARLTAPPLTKLNESLPPDLSGIVERLMAKNASQRIASAQQLLEVIKRTFAGGQRAAPSAAAPPLAEPAAQATADPTAPLPKRSRLPLILGGVLLAQAILIGGVWGYFEWRASEQQQQVRSEAVDKYERARQLYSEQQDYRQAAQLFNELASAWPDDPALGAPAKARAMICEARLLMAEGERVTAGYRFSEAEQLYSDALAKLSGALDTAGNLHDHVAEIRNEVEFRRAFVDVAAKVVELIDSGQYSQARNRIGVFRQKAQPVDMEEQILDRLAARIEDQSTQAQIDRILAEADRFAGQGRLNEALGKVREGLQQYSSSARLTEREAELTGRINYDDLLGRAQAAEDRGDYAAAINLYRQANDLKPSDDLRDRVSELRRRRAYQSGRDAELGGDFVTAEEQYLDALPLPEAKQSLQRLGKVVTKKALVEAADAAAAAGDDARARQLYQQVLDEMGPDAAVQRKLNDVTVRMETEQARAALDAGDLDAARKHLDNALAIDPAHPEANRLAEDLRVYQEYRDQLKVGDAARGKSDFGQAIEAYLQARQTLRGTGIDTTEIEKRLEDAEYDSWIAKARAAIEARQWKLARAHLKSAENVRRQATELIQRLREEINQNDPESDS